MAQQRAVATREKLMNAATDLIRRKGYAATSIDDICAQASVTKGAFFHHFKTKEDLVGESLAAWDLMAAGMEQSAGFLTLKDPRKRVFAYMDFFIGVLANPQTVKSCLAGTTVQEVGDTSSALRDAAHLCFANAATRFKSLLDDASKSSRSRVDTVSLANLWVAAMQGSLILYKASQDASVIRRSLEHVKDYIDSVLPRESAQTPGPRRQAKKR